MKMVKSLLLGSAAGFVVVAGAQAADLPVKAKPVEYVKVCSLYGAGFFYIPGTDTCIKIGGAIRVQANWNGLGDGTPSGLGNPSAAQGVFTRSNSLDVNFRTRIYFSVDTRQQTDFGTLRSYWRMGVNETTPTDGGGASSTGTAYWDRAFIQFAGFTVGRTVSFYDAVTFANFNYTNPRTLADSGAAGITVWAYTAQFGNGISASVSAEDPNGRGKFVVNAGSAALGLAAGIVNSNGLASNAGGNGFGFPDVVGALRVDQAWGSAQVMAAMHDASGSYYGSTDTTGHPDNAYGFAVGTGLAINLPTFGATANVNSQPNVDQFQANFAYTRGASGYATNGNGTSTLFNGNSNVAAGWLVDGVYGITAAGDQQVELTTAWSAYAGYQHIWTPQWRTSVYGGYLNVSYDDNASNMLCASGVINFHFSSGTCGPGTFNFSEWQLGTRTQWNPVNQLDVGVDVLYSRLNTVDPGNTVTTTETIGAHPAGIYTLSDENVWTVMFRVQRNFWP
jgi:hypothetical protein